MLTCSCCAELLLHLLCVRTAFRIIFRSNWTEDARSRYHAEGRALWRHVIEVVKAAYIIMTPTPTELVPRRYFRATEAMFADVTVPVTVLRAVDRGLPEIELRETRVFDPAKQPRHHPKVSWMLDKLIQLLEVE